MRCIDSTSIIFGHETTYVRCRSSGTMTHCTRECSELAENEIVDLDAILYDKTDDGDARVEYKKLLAIVKSQLVETDVSSIKPGDTITVLWKHNYYKLYRVLGRGHNSTHHRVYDADEMCIKVLHTSLLSEQRRMILTRY